MSLGQSLTSCSTRSRDCGPVNSLPNDDYRLHWTPDGFRSANKSLLRRSHLSLKKISVLADKKSIEIGRISTLREFTSHPRKRGRFCARAKLWNLLPTSRSSTAPWQPWKSSWERNASWRARTCGIFKPSPTRKIRIAWSPSWTTAPISCSDPAQ